MTIEELKSLRELNKKVRADLVRMKKLSLAHNYKSSFEDQEEKQEHFNELLPGFLDEFNSLCTRQVESRKYIDEILQPGYHHSILTMYYVYGLRCEDICRIYDKSPRWFWQQLKNIKSVITQDDI